MGDKSDLSDIKPIRQTHKLLYCSNCGEKQLKVGQHYCSNCGSSFYDEHNDTPSSETVDDDEIDRNLAYIGGWLLIPYIGFYLGCITALIAMFVTPSSTTYSTNNKAFLEILYVIMLIIAISCITQIHKRDKALISTVTVLYILEFIISADSAIHNHSFLAPVVYALAAAFWLAYFAESKRVKALLGSEQ